MRSPYRTSVPRAGRRRMLGWGRFVGIAQEGFCNTYDYAHCGAANASTSRDIRRVLNPRFLLCAESLCVAHPFMAEACSL